MRQFVVAVSLWSLAACGDIVQDMHPASSPQSQAVCTGEDTWEHFGRPTFEKYCFDCHAKIRRHARVQERRERIAQAIDSGAMPKGTAMSTEEKGRVLAWLACGAP